MDKKLGRGMLAILLANIINLIFNLLTNFILPRYLSVDSYSAIKTYQLYVNYVGIFALGYTDGMYLKYGGKELDKLDRSELRTGLWSLRVFLIIESIVLIILAILSKDKIIFAFVLTIMALNMSGYFKNLFQAVGEFKRYGRIMNMTTGLTFIVNIVLLFIVETDNYFIYLLCYVIVNIFIWMRLEINAYHLFHSNTMSRLFSPVLFISNIKSGILLMIGNFSSILLTSMDRWFVKIMMDSLQFAQYSFVVSLEGFLNTATTPVTITMYNFFCRKNDKDTVITARKYMLLFSSIIIAVAFPAKWIVELYLTNYVGSLKVLFLLFSAQMFFIPNKAIYVNLYKAKERQKQYFFKLIVVLISGAVSNSLFVTIFRYKEAFACATLFSAMIWILLSSIDFKEYSIEIKEIIYIIVQLIVFLFLGFNVNAVIGLALYVFETILMIFIFFREEIQVPLKIAVSKLKIRKNEV